jgi:hypothetical protein
MTPKQFKPLNPPFKNKDIILERVMAQVTWLYLTPKAQGSQTCKQPHLTAMESMEEASTENHYNYNVDAAQVYILINSQWEMRWWISAPW